MSPSQSKETSTSTPTPLYDTPTFYKTYTTLAPPTLEAHAALHSEWPLMLSLVGSVHNKQILDLGCGFGWFSRWASEQGAASVLGIDNSVKMLEHAEKVSGDQRVRYQARDLDLEEDEVFFPAGVLTPTEGEGKFDVVHSALTFHYITHLVPLFKRISASLNAGGKFIFSIQHPMWTATDNGEWQVDPETGEEYWPVRTYSQEGPRMSRWAGEGVRIYHRTVNGYLGALREAGFELVDLYEWIRGDGEVPEGMMDSGREGHRPAWLIVAARKRVS